MDPRHPSTMSFAEFARVLYGGRHVEVYRHVGDLRESAPEVRLPSVHTSARQVPDMDGCITMIDRTGSTVLAFHGDSVFRRAAQLISAMVGDVVCCEPVAVANDYSFWIKPGWEDTPLALAVAERRMEMAESMDDRPITVERRELQLLRGIHRRFVGQALAQGVHVSDSIMAQFTSGSELDAMPISSNEMSEPFFFFRPQGFDEGTERNDPGGMRL